MPNKDKINAEVVSAITKVIERDVTEANGQIRETKNILNLPNAAGLLVILNDTVEALSPDLVVYRVRQAINKRDQEGNLRHPHISAVLFISQTHFVQASDRLKLLPLLTVTTASSGSAEVVDYLDKTLTPQWSLFEGLPLVESDGEQFLEQDFRKYDPDQDAKDFLLF